MRIGIPKEIMNNENRVALTPAGVLTLTNAGHEVYLQTNAGKGSNFPDEEYVEAGATIVQTAKEVWSNELIMKVKEPFEEEFDYLYEGQIIFTYLHLASHEQLTKTLLDKKVDCLIAAYSITHTRNENFDFSPAYYTDITQIMVEDSTGFEQLAQLRDKTIGVMDGANTGPELAVRLYEMGMITEEIVSDSDTETVYSNLTVRKIPSYAELSEALETGEIDAACMDGCISHSYMTDSRILLDGTIQEQNYGVATNKDSELSRPVSETIQEMLDDGTIETLIDKWN